MEFDLALQRTADDQLGLLTTRQLKAAGLDRLAITRLTDAALVTKVRRGVYAVGSPELTWKQQILAACIHPTVSVAASHLTAARYHGLWDSDEIHITVRYPADVRVEGATVHRSRDLEQDDLSTDGPIQFTTPARTLVDLGLCLPRAQVSRLVDHSIATGLVGVDKLWAYRRRVGKPGRNGAGILGMCLGELPVDAILAESGPEVAVVRSLLAAQLPEPALQYPVTVGRSTFRIDVAYPSHGVAIEYDGEAWHSGPDQCARDRRRERQLQKAGWTVIRVTKEDVTTMGWILRVRALIGL